MISEEKLIDTVLKIFYYIKISDPSMGYSKWFVGITNNPDKKEMQHKIKTKIAFFKSWDLENKGTANTVKNYLIGKGCKESKSELTLKINIKDFMEDATFVYLYKNESNHSAY
jgi:hypothetical protein